MRKSDLGYNHTEDREAWSRVKTLLEEPSPPFFLLPMLTKGGTMFERVIKNANYKIVGKIIFEESRLVVQNENKPLLTIEDMELIKRAQNKELDAYVELYDKYFLTIGEIAAIVGYSYQWVWKQIQNLEVKTGGLQGRRNPSFGVIFTEERRRRISESTMGRVSPPYQRTPEMKKKISETLKRKYQSGELRVNAEAIAEAWQEGKYDKAAMGRGYSGWFYSYKMKKDFHFRSFLELKFMLLIEENEEVVKYEGEPFRIIYDGFHHYTPDFLINDKFLIELKPLKHLLYTSKKKFESKVEAAEKYCFEHEMEYKIIYDTDIDYRTHDFCRFLLNNPDVIRQYNIRIKSDKWKEWLN